MKTYTFTLHTQPQLCPLPCEDCVATVELAGKYRLYDLAALLIEAIGFDFDHAFGFYDNLSNPYGSETSYTLFADMGEGEEGEMGVQKTWIDDVFSKGTKMLLLFDYGDDWHFLVTCENVEETRAKKKTGRIVSVEGTPPTQYPDLDES